MTTPTSFRSTLLVLGCVALTPLAFAQSSTTSPSTSSTTTRTQSTSPSTSTSTVPNAASSTATNPTQTAPGAQTTAPFAPAPITTPVTTPVVPPTGTPVQGTPVRTAPGAVTQPVIPGAPAQVAQPPGATNASTMLDAQGGRIAVSGSSIDALAAGGVEVAVDPQNALANLRRANADGQAGVTAELQTRVDATSRALTESRARARAAGLSISDANYDQLAAEVRVREDMLRETLRNAARANSEEEWRTLQSVLDSQYAAYADAALRAHRLLTPGNP